MAIRKVAVQCGCGRDRDRDRVSSTPAVVSVFCTRITTSGRPRYSNGHPRMLPMMTLVPGFESHRGDVSTAVHANIKGTIAGDPSK